MSSNSRSLARERQARPPGCASRKAEKPHHAVVREFAGAVLDDRPVPIPPEHCVTVIAVLESLYRSQTTGREQPVEVIGESQPERS